MPNKHAHLCRVFFLRITYAGFLIRVAWLRQHYQLAQCSSNKLLYKLHFTTAMLRLWNQGLTHQYEASWQIKQFVICYHEQYVSHNITSQWMKCQKKRRILQFLKFNCHYMVPAICGLMHYCSHHQELPSQDAIQIANNISDLGQIYNREDMDTSSPVSVHKRILQLHLPIVLQKQSPLLCSFLTNWSPLQRNPQHQNMFPKLIDWYFLKGKRPSTWRRWSACTQHGSSRSCFQHINQLLRPRGGTNNKVQCSSAMFDWNALNWPPYSTLSDLHLATWCHKCSVPNARTDYGNKKGGAVEGNLNHTFCGIHGTVTLQYLWFSNRTFHMDYLQNLIYGLEKFL
jgi:hypothetical protein